MDVVTVVIAGLKNDSVCLIDSLFLGEFGFQMSEGGIDRAVEEPAHQTESENVAALEDAFVVETAVGESRFGHSRYWHLYNLVADTELLERTVGGIQCFFKVRFLERIDVDNDNTSRFEEFDILLESCGIHRHKHIAGITGGVHASADTHLEAGHSAKRTLRSTYLGRIVGKGRHLIAQPGRHIGKDVSGKLHSVA